MVVLLAKNGQLCNRLFIISAFVANAMEYKYKLISDSFDDYLHQFESVNDEAAFFNIRFLNSYNNIERFYLRLISKIAYSNSSLAQRLKLVPQLQNGNINNDEFIRNAISKKLVVRGWPFWDVENFIKHSTAIKKIFAPRKQYVERASNFINSIPVKYDYLIGVHIRRGDYINHVNGRFYFSFTTYAQKMAEVYEQVILSGKSAAFILCSNEPVELNSDVSFPYYISSLDGMSDLVLLSKCNYIFGPPSTYSMWASFYGDVPYNNFFSAEEYMALKDFSPIIAPSTFANGRVLKDVYETYSN